MVVSQSGRRSFSSVVPRRLDGGVLIQLVALVTRGYHVRSRALGTPRFL